MASPFARYGNKLFDSEYRVNGLWNTILAKYYPPGYNLNEYIICPEAYGKGTDTNGIRADLLVCKLDGAAEGNISTAKVLYEGKGINGDSFEQMEKQLDKFLMESARLKGFSCTVIGAKGNCVQFFSWKSDQFKAMRWGNGKSGAGREVTGLFEGRKIYDIKEDDEWADVQELLQRFSSYP